MGDRLRTTVRCQAVPLLVGAFAGIVVGLLIGWLVWPVSWYDTDPSDLRLQHQTSYVVMTSDSLAVTGDIEGARQRLAELIDDDTTWYEVANFVEMVAAERESQGDLAGALRLRRMSQAMGMPLATATTFDPRANVEKPAGLLYGLAALVLVGFGVGGYLYSMRGRTRGYARSATSASRARTTKAASWLDRVASAPARPGRLDLQGEPGDPDSDEAYAGDEAGRGGWEDQTPPTMSIARHAQSAETTGARPTSWVTSRPGNGDPYLTSNDADASLDDEWEDEEDDDLISEDGDMVDAREDAPASPRPVQLPPQRVPEPEVPKPDVPRGARAVVEVSDLDETPDALGVFQAEYILGDDDFDVSYTIETAEGEFLGECGVTLVDVLDVEGGVQRSDAFEVWLFDKGDIRTVSKVLVSDHALSDEARTARLSAKGELVPAEVGGEVVLETNALRVTVTVRDCEFSAGSDGPEGFFVRLDLELLAESSDAIP